MKKHALVIGVEEYRHNISPLKCARADAEAIAQRLRDVCRFDSVRLMVDSNGADEPVAANIILALKDLAGDLRSEDLFVLFFAGHGMEENDYGYLLARDAVPGETEFGHLALKTMKDRIGKLAVRKRIMLLDACRNNPTNGRSDEANPMGDVLSRDIRATAKAEGIADCTTGLLLACGPGQRAFEWANKGHGVFTHYVIEAIDQSTEREEPFEFEDLASYAQREVERWSRATLGAVLQQPYYEKFGRADSLILSEGHRRNRNLQKGNVGKLIDVDWAEVTIESEPEGAVLSIDGRKLGLTPIVVTLKAGLYEFRVEKTGFEVYERRKQFDGSGNATIRLELKALPSPVPETETQIGSSVLPHDPRAPSVAKLDEESYQPRPQVAVNTVNIIRKGQVWAPLGDGIYGTVNCLASYNDHLIAGGKFSDAGDNNEINIAAYDGSDWIAMTPPGPGFVVTAMVPFQGSLFAVSERGCLAKWNGVEWHIIGRTRGTTSCLTSFKGELIFSLDRSVYRVDGTDFHILGNKFPWNVYALQVCNDKLLAGGGHRRRIFGLTANQDVKNQEIIFSWETSGWTALGTIDGIEEDFFSAFPPVVELLAEHHEAPLAVGRFVANSVDKAAVAQFNGERWQNIWTQEFQHVCVLEEFGGTLVSGGTPADEHTCEIPLVHYLSDNGWKDIGGKSWKQRLGDEFHPRVYALKEFEGKLIAAGSFLSAGGVTLNSIAAWDG